MKEIFRTKTFAMTVLLWLALLIIVGGAAGGLARYLGLGWTAAGTLAVAAIIVAILIGAFASWIASNIVDEQHPFGAQPEPKD